MQKYYEILKTKNIITPSGKINKNKINLIVGSMTLPFAEMVWVSTGGDRATLNRMTETFITMNTAAERGKLFKIIQTMYGLMGVRFADEAQYLPASPAALEYFILTFIVDFNEIIKDYIAEESGI